MDLFRFLLVSLNAEAILQESTKHRRRDRLRNMINGLGLGDVYSATIERIRRQDGDKSRLGMETLMWVCHAERPLRADELCHALAVELGTDFNADNIPSMATLLSCCQGLITVEKESSTVRLVHFTLREYLSAHPDIFCSPHSAMSEICLTYLNSQQVKDLSPETSDDLSTLIHDNPLLEYCSLYWGVHAKRELSDSARSLALDFLLGCGTHPSQAILWEQINDKYLYYERDVFWSGGLHCASIFGISELVAPLVDMGWYDINEEDSDFHTPLALAARYGHTEMVKMLLELGEIDPDKPSSLDGGTPLSLAAEAGHEGVVKILLEREDVNPNAQTSDEGETPLLYAAFRGHEGVVRILLERGDVSPDKPNSYGNTPLWYAAGQGHEGVVKILLGREDVNPDKPDNRGRTPLSEAAEEGHEEVVKILLRREEVNPNRPDNNGQTPLMLAARNDHLGVVELLQSPNAVS